MKNTFGYLLLVFAALMLLTVIGGMNSIFASISSTWTTDQTAKIADRIAQVLWFGGVVMVVVLGYAMFTSTNKGGGSGRRQSQSQDQYMISDGSTPPMPAQQQKMLAADIDGDWYEIEAPKQRQLV